MSWGARFGVLVRAGGAYFALVPLSIPLLLALLVEPRASASNPFVEAPPIRYDALASQPEPLPGHSVILPVEQGDTLGSILQSGGLAPSEVPSLLASLSGSLDPRRLRPGQQLRFHYDDDGSISRIDARLNGWGEVVARKEGDRFAVESVPFETRSTTVLVSATIESSLWSAVSSLGESPALAQPLADIFQWDIDFFRLQKGDRFSAVVVKNFVGDDVAGYGPVLAARFVHGGQTYEAFRYEAADGTAGFYNREGRPLRKQFLRSPLKFSRITSGFTHRRFHPVLKTFRPHLAIDYGAPTGTPVMATADGVVVSATFESGEGNYVRIRHSSTTETWYLHLSRFAKGIKRGSRVEQGDVIGYVGSTGLATAPHLDYRVRQKGEWVNPLKLKSIMPDPLHGSALARFRRQVTQVLPQLSVSEEQFTVASRGNPSVE
ncbi:MAG TPA: peptidoglycan DD-metalloendopeptidase family protein [Thermoanaerobaculia bacterium]|nr:peptidoglycan DD-metalloendopeptidase family protein [Thermoanaerobaculia bacterium]